MCASTLSLCGPQDQTQGFVGAGQALRHLSYTHCPFSWRTIHIFCNNSKQPFASWCTEAFVWCVWQIPFLSLFFFNLAYYQCFCSHNFLLFILFLLFIYLFFKVYWRHCLTLWPRLSWNWFFNLADLEWIILLSLSREYRDYRHSPPAPSHTQPQGSSLWEVFLSFSEVPEYCSQRPRLWWVGHWPTSSCPMLSF